MYNQFVLDNMENIYTNLPILCRIRTMGGNTI